MSLLKQRKNIPDDWINCELGEVLTLQRGYDLPHRLRKDGEVPIISSSGVSGRHDKAMVSPPGVVTGRYGTIGEIFYVNEPFWPLNTTLYVRDFRGMTAEYAYHYLKTINFASHSGKSGIPESIEMMFIKKLFISQLTKLNKLLSLIYSPIPMC
ncbi:restriction endonuclease subunit S [Klebsiella pneumoniae]|uniref:restriction endonuclease subunit S n=1 Tax=Klebsiella pneumoniae TaxID=573 RepID=UPI003217B9BF